MDTNTFLRAVIGTAGYYCLFASNSTTSKRTKRFYEDINVLIQEAHDLDALGYDVYFGLAAFETGESRKSDNVKHLRSFFLDLDCGASKDYPTKKAALIGLKSFC